MTEDEVIKAEQEVARSEAARQILDAPIFNDAFAHIEQTIIARWKSTQPNDTNERERAFSELRLVNAVRGYFTSAIGTGSVAREKLSMIERIKRGFGRM